MEVSSNERKGVIEMRKRLKVALVTLSLAGAIAGGTTAIASAASGSSSSTQATPSTSSATPSATTPSAPGNSGNCPHM